MLRQTLIRATKPAFQLQQRTISTSVARMAAGDTGATRSGGVASSDAFNKREQADEALYVRKKEREKLMALKAKITEQQKHLKDLEDHIDDLSKEGDKK